MGAECHHGGDYVRRHVAALFALGAHARLCPFTASLLANPFSHAPLLCGTDAICENVVTAAILALTLRKNSGFAVILDFAKVPVFYRLNIARKMALGTALDRPQGKRIPRFKVVVAMVNQLKATFTIPPLVRFVLELEHIECS